MTSLRLAVTCLLAVTAPVWSQDGDQASVDMTTFPGLVHLNTSVTFTCQLRGFQAQAETIVNFNKAVLAEDLHQAAVNEQISVQSSISGLYRNLPRYSIERRTLGNVTEYSLHINGVHLEDSGWFSCSARHDSYGLKYAVKQLEVYRPPQTRLSINETRTGHAETRLEWNDTLSYTEGDLIPVHCISENILPIPSVELWITDSDKESVNPLASPRPISGLVDRWRQQPGEKWRDLNDAYLVATELNRHCAALAGVKGNCPLSFDYNVTATPRGLTADWRYDDKQLTCLVKMRDFERDEAHASVALTIFYKPRLSCHSVTTGLIRTLVCLTAANPKVTPGDRVWTEGPCSQAPSNPISDVSPKYKLNDLPGAVSSKNATFVLQLHNATNVNQKFCLRVTNDQGTTMQDLTYKDPPPQRGAASIVTSSGLLLVATVLLGRRV
jgi:hypothetical protein